MSPKNKRYRKPMRGAGHADLWVTKENFVVQICTMSDLHLLNSFMKLLNHARTAMFKGLITKQLNEEFEKDSQRYRDAVASAGTGFSAYIHDGGPMKPMSELLLNHGHPAMRVMFNELCFRGLLARMPETL